MAGQQTEDRRNRVPCKYLSTPQGCYRKPCPYSHDQGVIANAKKKPCNFVLKPGGCRNEDDCTFSHDLNDALQQFQNDPSSMSSSHMRQTNWRQSADNNAPPAAMNGHTHRATTTPAKDHRPTLPRSALEAKYRRWRYSAMGKPPYRPLYGAIGRFFQEALELVNGDAATDDVAILQETITCLGSDGGLQRIIELLSNRLDGHDERVAELFTTRILPFFQTITHPNVTASGLLETPIYTIYNTIFGPFGKRAVEVFSSLANIFHLLPIEALEAISAVLSRTVDLNGAAQITEGITPITEVLAAALNSYEGDNDERAVRAYRHLQRLQRRLGIGATIPTAHKSNCANGKSDSKPLATFNLMRDPPGWLSEHGPRHDNDSDSIQDISILPTSEEIMSTRLEYLPPMDPAELHLAGVEGLLDRHFRLLREDTIGQLRDAIRIELQRLQNPTGHQDKPGRGGQGIRTHSYPDLQLGDLRCDQHKGLEFFAHFSQPQHLQNLSEKERREWWDRSRRLQKDTLVCIIDASGSAIFCMILDTSHHETDDAKQSESQQQKKAKMLPPSETLACHADYASVTLRLVGTDDASAKKVIWQYADCVARRARPQSVLVEFPGVLLPSFQPTLEALQTMSKSADLPLAEFLAPLGQEGSIEIPPPTYAQQPRFSFDLSCIMKGEQSLRLYPVTPFDVNALRSGSTLDDAQAGALVAALSRRLALIQGPPGTGKSYTGVSITRVLLANKKVANLGPIICICYTNHALDQILEHLHESGITQIIRMGSRSKSEVLIPLNLRNVASRMDKTKEERKRSGQMFGHLKEDMREIDRIIQKISKAGSPQGLENYLESNHPHHYMDIFGPDKDGFERVQHDHMIADWLAGANYYEVPAFSRQHRGVSINFRALEEKSVLSMSLRERQAIHNFWIKDARESLEHDFLSALALYHEHKKEHDRIRNELDLRCLQQANVIGVTTSGLARNIDLLRRLRAKVLICEEAGEVLEAHVLTALLPSVEHAILIGDHLQLRPQIQNYELQHDNPRGEQYSLDVSLFERLVDPKISQSLRIPFSILGTQRRMHPSIAQLIREPLYPSLKDAEVVNNYPDVAGMKRRLFWFDHNHPEAGSDASDIVSTSHSNDFEVEMTASLVSHLVRQGVYQANDIAVLTPYLGQLMKLRRQLADRFEVTLDDRDKDELEKAGIAIEDDGRTSIVKTTLLNTLKVATIDNFQGEEAKVVVISLVRCNPQNKCGFLKTSNRINVLLSRAKHGMYIIGNSKTSAHVPMWSDVMSILKRDDNIGPALDLCCPRHQDTPIRVSSLEDFVRFSPEGGCDIKCAQRLGCGHACVQRCHSTVLHEAVKCLEDCPRTKPGCDHLCPLPCGTKCEDKCRVLVQGLDIPLRCGHRVTSLPCWQYQDQKSIRCDVKVDRKVDACGHTINVKCHQDVNDTNFRCHAPCGGNQDCGHACTTRCFQCRTANGEGHGKCLQACDRPFETCNHSCRKPCHGKEPCGLCTAPCNVRCSHSQCPNVCSEPCAPCAEDSCSSFCPHSYCSLPCASPCNWIPCSKRCEKVLQCGHQCPSVCGEQCPSMIYCQICATDNIKDQIVDFIEALTYREIDLDEDPCVFPQCKHFLTLTNMDGQMDLQSCYNLDGNGVALSIKKSEPFSEQLKKIPTCPSCRGSLRNISRYGRIVRRALLDEGTKRFASWAQASYIPLAEDFHKAEQELSQSDGNLDGALQALAAGQNPVRSLNGKRDRQINRIFNATMFSDRYAEMRKIRPQLIKYFQKVRKDETPVEKVWHMVEASRRRQGKTTDEISLDSQVSLTTFHIMAESLVIRCDIAIMADFLAQLARAPVGSVDATFSVDLQSNRDDCTKLIDAAKASKDLEREVEGHIFYARYIALERSCNRTLMTPARSEALKIDAESHIDLAHDLCKRYGGKTEALVPEIKAAERALNDGTFMSTVSAEERLAVLAAMRHEFAGTGHWYTCANGHPFTIGECGMPMETARCPTCGETIGGQHHQAMAGTNRAEELEREFAGLEV